MAAHPPTEIQPLKLRRGLPSHNPAGISLELSDGDSASHSLVTLRRRFRLPLTLRRRFRLLHSDGDSATYSPTATPRRRLPSSPLTRDFTPAASYCNPTATLRRRMPSLSDGDLSISDGDCPHTLDGDSAGLNEWRQGWCAGAGNNLFRQRSATPNSGPCALPLQQRSGLMERVVGGHGGLVVLYHLPSQNPAQDLHEAKHTNAQTKVGALHTHKHTYMQHTLNTHTHTRTNKQTNTLTHAFTHMHSHTNTSRTRALANAHASARTRTRTRAHTLASASSRSRSHSLTHALPLSLSISPSPYLPHPLKLKFKLKTPCHCLPAPFTSFCPLPLTILRSAWHARLVFVR